MKTLVFTWLLIVLAGIPLPVEAQPGHAKDVLIGYFGPNDMAHPEGGDMWCAATLAIEQANLAGGFHGRPFKLITGWSENPWGSGVKALTHMVYQDQVWAIIGGIDGPSTHLAEQVVAKARLPLLSGANADRTANLANVPWMFSILPGHHLQAAALTKTIESQVKRKRFVMVSSVDHDAHILTDELNRCLRKRQLSPHYHFEFKPGHLHDSEPVNHIIKANAEAVVIAASLQDTAHLTVRLRQKGFNGILFGGACMSRQAFVDIAGEAAEGVIFPLLYRPSETTRQFNKDMLDHSGRSANDLSAHTYDTVKLLLEAIQQAGLNRQHIRDTVSKLSPWQGVTGTIHWDQQGSNTRPVTTGTLLNGCVTPYPITVSERPSSTRPQSR
ncbi:MAG: ABC transporter substrate-binding protein [Phycisphaeraceae bacterium]|nr:ABC transporter substrate-binding protein [Phycisphaeraceae bacterium]